MSALLRLLLVPLSDDGVILARMLPASPQVVAACESNDKREQEKDDPGHAKLPEQNANINDLCVLQDNDDKQRSQR